MTPEPESANLLTPPLREAVAQAIGRTANDSDWSLWLDSADAALDVVRAAMPPLNRIASEIEQAADLDRSRVDDIAYEVEAMLLEWLS